MKTSLITKNKRLPDFIKTHDIFSKFDEIAKVFPKIGLPNCSILAKDVEYLPLFAATFKQKMIKSFKSPYIGYFYDTARAGRIRRLLELCAPSEFVKNNKLIVPTRFRSEFTDFNRAFFECRHHEDQRRYYVKDEYNHIHHPLKLSTTSKIVFSSDGSQGMWDIATMSERGFESCQSWTGCYARNLIGSIVDPCAGIIYLTNGVELGKGVKMLYRAVVRYVVSKNTHKPALLIEQIYGSNDTDSKSDDEVYPLFAAFLKKKTQNKLPIITRAKGYQIPNSQIVRKMSSCGSFDNAKYYCKSYRDSGIPYAKSNALYLAKIKA